MAFNKVDTLAGSDKKEFLNMLQAKYPDAIFISAQKGINLNSLYDKIFSLVEGSLVTEEFSIPNTDSGVYKYISGLYDRVEILHTKHLSKSIKLKIRSQRSEIDKIRKHLEDTKNGNLNRKGVTRKKRVKAV